MKMIEEKRRTTTLQSKPHGMDDGLKLKDCGYSRLDSNHEPVVAASSKGKGDEETMAKPKPKEASGATGIRTAENHPSPDEPLVAVNNNEHDVTLDIQPLPLPPMNRGGGGGGPGARTTTSQPGAVAVYSPRYGGGERGDVATAAAAAAADPPTTSSRSNTTDPVGSRVDDATENVNSNTTTTIINHQDEDNNINATSAPNNSNEEYEQNYDMLAEALPVEDDEEMHGTDHQQARPMVEGSSSTALPIWKIVVVAAAGLLLIGGIAAGAMCGDGNCSSSNNNEEDTTLSGFDQSLPPIISEEQTMAPTTYYRNPNDAKDIEWSIKYFLGLNYFNHDVTNNNNKADALRWILFEDPLRINSTDPYRLLQRYVLVHFYFQTTRERPWINCNRPTTPTTTSLEEQDSIETITNKRDTNIANTTTSMCYRPDSNSLDFWGTKWLTGQNECDWAGVQCEGGGNVTDLHMDSNDLNGPLPWELSKLSHLKWLDLWNNSLSGTIPGELLGNNPSSPTTGMILNLRKNQLNGTIPKRMLVGGGRVLSLRENFLEGTIPIQVSNWGRVFLASNLLSGLMPSEVYRSTSLIYFDAKNNRNIRGTLPSQVGHASSLRSLDLSNTGMNGTIPSELGLLLDLRDIKLIDTDLSGPIPEELFHNQSKVRNFDVSGSRFSGTISTGLGLWTGLATWHLANNEFTGTIPTLLGDLTTLHSVTLNGNNFAEDSAVPNELCALKPNGGSDKWELVADCSPDETTGIPIMVCPHQCCTSCCNPRTGICRLNSLG